MHAKRLITSYLVLLLSLAACASIPQPVMQPTTSVTDIVVATSPTEPDWKPQPSAVLTDGTCSLGLQEGKWCLHSPQGAQELDKPWLDAILLDYSPVSNKALIASRFPTHGAGPANMSVSDMLVYDLASEQASTIFQEEFIISAAWAPDGQSIAYIRTTDVTNELRWRGADGTDGLLASEVPYMFSISPDGRQVAFARDSRYVFGGVPGFYIVDVASGTEWRISGADRAGSGGAEDRILWAPDMQRLLLPVNNEYLRAMADGSGVTQFTFDVALQSEPWYGFLPYKLLWHPDGRHLIAMVEAGGMGSAIPVTWYVLLWEVNTEANVVLGAQVLEEGVVLKGWDVVGQSVWVMPVEEAGMPYTVALP